MGRHARHGRGRRARQRPLPRPHDLRDDRVGARGVAGRNRGGPARSRDGVRLRQEPAAADRRGGARGRLPRERRRSRGAPRRGAALARLSQAHAAARAAERGLRVPEPRRGIGAAAGRLARLCRRARRRGRAQGRGLRRGARLARLRELRGERGRRVRARRGEPDRPHARGCGRTLRRPAGGGDRAGGGVRLMAALVVEGGHALSGVVTVEGNKNVALPILAACLLTPEPCVLENVPRIRDVQAMCQLLEGLGAQIEGVGTSTLTVRCPEIRSTDPDRTLVSRIRGSVLLTAPLLARAGRAGLGEPGGDFPGRRSVTTHRRALAALGARPEAGNARALVAPEGLVGASFYLDEASVTATETALIAAVTARGTTEIRNAAGEPHVAELARFLNSLGAQ